MHERSEGEKLCTRCKQIKARSAANWHQDKAHDDGLSSWCRECMVEYAKLYRKRKGKSIDDLAKEVAEGQ